MVIMKDLKYLVILSLLTLNCSGSIEDQEIDETGVCEYDINVNFEFGLSGSDVFWNGVGHMSLGPEDSGCDQPVGSLWMDVNLSMHFDENTVIDTSSIGLFDFNFYSIRFPCNDLGNQESNWYSLNTSIIDSTILPIRRVNPFVWDNEEGNPKFEIGFDNLGLGIIRIEALKLKMSRDIINEADVPENIVLYVNCTGFEICP